MGARTSGFGAKRDAPHHGGNTLTGGHGDDSSPAVFYSPLRNMAGPSATGPRFSTHGFPPTSEGRRPGFPVTFPRQPPRLFIGFNSP